MTAISVSTLKKQLYERTKRDNYQEPRWLVDKHLTRETFTGQVLDPGCGGGTIGSACRDHGLNAVGSDLVDRGFKCTIRDFFTFTAPVANSNPPYGRAEKFARHALAPAENKVVLLLRLAFLDSIRRERGSSLTTRSASCGSACRGRRCLTDSPPAPVARGTATARWSCPRRAAGRCCTGSSFGI
jgi:hypothetical protein